MWFCCQIWQCNFKTCLGPLKIWKTLNGWSHVVYPSKGDGASKNFAESRERKREGHSSATMSGHEFQPRDIPRGATFDDFQVDTGSRSQRAAMTECQEFRLKGITRGSTHDGVQIMDSETAVRTSFHDIAGTSTYDASVRTVEGKSLCPDSSHSLENQEFNNFIDEFSAPSFDEEEASSVTIEELPPENVAAENHPQPSSQVPKNVIVRDRVASSSEDSCLYESATGLSSTRLQQQDESELFGLDSTSEKLGGEVEGTLAEHITRTMQASSTLVPYRALSTDLSQLEKSLDYWHQQHLRQNYGHDVSGEDEEPHSKVRYNDTGSLEEVNREHQVDYVVQGGDTSRCVSYGYSDQHQYRQLWDLRATLEMNENLSNQRVVNKEIITSSNEIITSAEETVTSTSTIRTVKTCTRSQSFIEISTGSAGYNIEQTYINAANSRMNCTAVQSTYEYEIQSFHGSHESFGTIDNGGYSTDTSFMDQPQNYGFGGSNNDRQTHRLEQLRADSGYRSLENPPAPIIGVCQESFDMTGMPPPPPNIGICQESFDMTGLPPPPPPLPLPPPPPLIPIHTIDSITVADYHAVLLPPPPPPPPPLIPIHTIDSISLADYHAVLPPPPPPPPLIPIHTIDSITVADYHVEMPMNYDTPHHVGESSTNQGVNEQMTIGYYTSMPQYFEPDEGVAELQSPPATNIDYSSWESPQRKSYRSASRKRREFGVGCGSGRALAHIVTEAEYSRSRIIKSYGVAYSRDYSVDEKSDALFREFSRCDPVKTHPSSYPRQPSIHSAPYPVQEPRRMQSRPKVSDEERLPQNLLLLLLPGLTREDDDSVPVITLDDHHHHKDDCNDCDNDDDNDTD